MRTAISLVGLLVGVVVLVAAISSCDSADGPGDESATPAQKPAPPAEAPIFEYVSAPDSSFEWKNVGELPGGGISVEMTSQVWQGITWKHRIAVVRPDKPRHPELCLLFITGGNPAGEEFGLALMISEVLGMPIAVLGDIPNQPLFDNLNEDGLISHTFSKYLETGDATWPCLFPMTKAAVRAMDTLQMLFEDETGPGIEGFIVTGASKRGWTTWFTGEVDDRVKAIIPLVYDNLDLPAQMAHHITQWGAHSEQINDYTERGLPDLIGSEEGKKLAAVVDPYTYRDRATMPKLIVTGTNDRYWPLDAASLYFDDLPAPRHILYVPNSGHGLDDLERAINGLVGFIMACAGDAPMPALDWEFSEGDEGLTATANSDVAPERALAWTATSDSKDFREAKWTSEAVEAADGAYAHTMPIPAEGFAALFLELTFDAKGRDFPLSTLVRIVGGE